MTGWLFTLLLFSSGDLRELGADDFRARERASRRAEMVAPMNLVPMLRGLRSEDAEIRRRSRLVRDVAFRRTSTIREAWAFAAAIPDAVAVLYSPGDPWLSWPIETNYVRDGGYRLHRAIAFVAEVTGTARNSAPPCVKAIYDPGDMVGYVNIMRHRIQGKPFPYSE